MLTVTGAAAAAIHHLLERSRATAGGGLRIAATQHTIRAGLVRAPAAEDALVVVASVGARVFLDATAATLLDDKILDVVLGTRGRVAFVASDTQHPNPPGNPSPRPETRPRPTRTVRSNHPIGQDRQGRAGVSP